MLVKVINNKLQLKLKCRLRTYNVPSLDDLPRPERKREAFIVSPFLSLQVENLIIFESANVKNRQLIARFTPYFTIIYVI